MKINMGERVASAMRPVAGSLGRTGAAGGHERLALRHDLRSLVMQLLRRRDHALSAGARLVDDGTSLSCSTIAELERIVQCRGPLLALPAEVEPDYLRELHASSLVARTLLAVVPALLFCLIALVAESVLGLTADVAALMRNVAATVVLPVTIASTAMVWLSTHGRATELALAVSGLVLVVALEWLRGNCQGAACQFDHTIIACIPITLVVFGAFRFGSAFMLLLGYVAVVLTSSTLIDASERTMGMWTGEAILLVIATVTVLTNESRYRRNWVARRLIQFQAQRDPLTGLRNRRSFEQFYEIVSAQARREGASLCLAIADLDHFKMINDRYGHGRGDDVLREVAAVLAHFSRRPLDAVGRIGGEEFGILLYDCDHASALQRLQELAQQIRALRVQNENVPLETLTVSVGGAILSGWLTLSNAYDSADKHLYVVKNGGRNGVRVGHVNAG